MRPIRHPSEIVLLAERCLGVTLGSERSELAELEAVSIEMTIEATRVSFIIWSSMRREKA